MVGAGTSRGGLGWNTYAKAGRLTVPLTGVAYACGRVLNIALGTGTTNGFRCTGANHVLLHKVYTLSAHRLESADLESKRTTVPEDHPGCNEPVDPISVVNPVGVPSSDLRLAGETPLHILSPLKRVGP